MINRFFFLFLTTTLMVLSVSVLASVNTASYILPHTQHTPIELKPVSFSDLDNSYKTASVCFLGQAGCGSDAEFEKNDEGMLMNAANQCLQEGFKTWRCKAPLVRTGQCPHYPSYYLSCECPSEYSIPVDTCIDNYQIADEVCTNSEGIKLTNKCKCNPDWPAEWECADKGRTYPNPQYGGCWDAKNAWYYVPECPHCDLSKYPYTQEEVLANNAMASGSDIGCQTDDGVWHYDSYRCNTRLYPQTYCEYGPESGTKTCTDSNGDKRYQACRSTPPCPREGMNTPLDDCTAQNKIGNETCESDTGMIYTDKCVCGAPMIGEWVCADMGRKVDNSLGCFNNSDAFYYFKSCQPCEAKYKYSEQDCINKYAQPKNTSDYCIVGDEKSFEANPRTGTKKYTGCQCNPSWPAEWECADMGRDYPNPQYGGCWDASNAWYYVPECPQCNEAVYKYTQTDIEAKNGSINGAENKRCQRDDKVWLYDSYGCNKSTYPLTDCPAGAADGTKVCTDMEGKSHFQSCKITCKIGSIYYADGTCSTEVVSGKTALGIVVYLDASGEHGQVMSAWSVDKEGNKSSKNVGMVWADYNGDYYDIASLPNYTKEAVITDFNSCRNTDNILSDTQTNYPAAKAARKYAPTSETKGKWCLPAAGIATSIYVNQSVIQAGISKLGGVTYPSCCTWSSSESETNWAWYSGLYYDNGLSSSLKDSDNLFVRPVLEF